jgi:hypothetical protein
VMVVYDPLARPAWATFVFLDRRLDASFRDRA